MDIKKIVTDYIKAENTDYAIMVYTFLLIFLEGHRHSYYKLSCELEEP